MADVRITPTSGSIQFTGSSDIDSLTLQYTSSALQTTGSFKVSGSIYLNNVDIQALAIAYAIALG